jgi:hypothetical protein
MKIKVSSSNINSTKAKNKELIIHNLNNNRHEDHKGSKYIYMDKSINLSIQKLANKINLDPIINTFKINDILNEFYFKRVLEMLDVIQI